MRSSSGAPRKASAWRCASLPYVVGMFLAIGMLRAAGGMDLIGALLRPLTDAAHFPPEVVPMALIRPFSGSAALGVLGDIRPPLSAGIPCRC